MVSCITIHYDLSINTSRQRQSKSVDPAFIVAKIVDPGAYYVVSKTLLAPQNGSTILGVPKGGEFAPPGKEVP
jgi:hypothetical protein